MPHTRERAARLRRAPKRPSPWPCLQGSRPPQKAPYLSAPHHKSIPQHQQQGTPFCDRPGLAGTMKGG